MRHYRQSKLPSGLITLEELARTSAAVDEQPFHPIPANLVIATARIPAPQEAPLPYRSIECDGIDELVGSGVSAWRETLAWLGSGATKVTLAHAERRHFEEETTPSGLIIASNEPKIPEFEGYYASAAEMDALEAMTGQINAGLAQPVDAGVGNYL